MAIIYYPSDQFVLQRTVTSQPSMTEIQLDTNPSTVLVFTGSSNYTASILSASYSETASYVSTAGTATNLGLTAYNISVLNASQSHWAESASYASSSFSRGGTFITPGIAENVFIPIWVAPHSATLTSIRATYMSGSNATFNARKNFTSAVLSASAVAASGSWSTYTALAQTAFAAGDSLELVLVSGSNDLQALSIQCNFIK